MFQVVDPNEKPDPLYKAPVEDVPVKVEYVLPEDSVLRRLVLPHSLKSRLATEKDVPRIVEEAKILHAICFERNGMYGGAYAMHHSQIDDKDPLSFFVTWDRKIVINPVVINHSGYEVDSTEGCVTFNHIPQIVVKRWRKMDVEYVTIMVSEVDETEFRLSSTIKEHVVGRESFIFQHEIGHENAEYIYPFNK